MRWRFERVKSPGLDEGKIGSLGPTSTGRGEMKTLRSPADLFFPCATRRAPDDLSYKSPDAALKGGPVGGWLSIP